MAFTDVTITGTFHRADGNPASGYVIAELTVPLTNGTAQADVVPIRGVLNAKGELKSEAEGPYVLVANNDNETEPSGSAYQFTLQLDGVPPRTFYASIPATGEPIDITALEPKTLSSPPVSTYALKTEVAVKASKAELVTAESTAAAVSAANASAIKGLTNAPQLWNKYGLRRFRALSGDAMFKTVPIICVGDSITYGQGGNNNTGAPENEPDAAEGWVGQLRKIFGSSPQSAAQNPGEGFWFPDDSRVTVTGGVSNNWACAALRHAERLKAGQKLTFTIPVGVTSVGIVQANMPKSFNEAGTKEADVTGKYKVGAGAETPLSALTGTGIPIEQFISVAGEAGKTFEILGPASAQTYITAIDPRAGSAGYILHRMGQPGYVSGDLLGGQTTGVLNQTEAVNQTYAIRATYRWSEPGLVILSFGTNDQNFQSSGGTTAQRGVTLAKYTEWMKQYANQAVADGWCVLILGEPRNPNEPTGAGIASSDEYWGAMKAFALESEHVAFMDVGELWGNNTAATALGLTESNTVHPNRKGHGDIARMVYRALTGGAPVGVAATVPA